MYMLANGMVDVLAKLGIVDRVGYSFACFYVICCYFASVFSFDTIACFILMSFLYGCTFFFKSSM